MRCIWLNEKKTCLESKLTNWATKPTAPLSSTKRNACAHGGMEVEAQSRKQKMRRWSESDSPMALLLFSSLNFCSLFPFRPTSKAWIFSQVVCAAPTNRFFFFILLTYKVPQIWLCNFLVSFPLNTICVFCCIFACVVTCAHRLIALAIAFVVLNSLLLCLTYVPSISLFITLHFTCLLR